MPDADEHLFVDKRWMTVDEIEAIAGIFCQAGVNKIRLTGGEPLVRKDIDKIIIVLSGLPVELTLTTNGIRLHEFADLLQQAGIRSLNISLDTLDENKFELITGRNDFGKVWQNILHLANENFHIKINMVVMKGLNENEIKHFVALTKDMPVHVRFIEFMPFNGNKWSSNKVLGWQEMLDIIESEYSFIKLKDDVHDTAKKYMVPGYRGSFAVISTMTAPFCSGCNRLRLTADGKMRNCLFSSKEIDLLTPFRMGEDIMPLINQSVFEKAEATGGQLSTNLSFLDNSIIHNRSMIDIGG